MGRGLVVAVAILVGVTLAPRAQPHDEMQVPLIAFEREGSTPPPPQLFVIRPDGSSERRIATGPNQAFTDPAWSPDGRRLAFVWQDAEKFPTRLTVADADGGRRRVVTAATVALSSLELAAPAWAPDARRLAFSLNVRGTFEIFVVNTNGSGLKRLTRNRVNNVDPAWSPDGRTILFGRSVSRFVDSPYFVFAMNADGTQQHRLLRLRSGEPAWSPDGSKIAFSSSTSGKPAVYVANSDGSGVHRLTQRDSQAYGPAWSPDGRRIAFQSDRDGNFDLYTMNADGGDPRRLTRSPRSEFNASWQPLIP
jgi:TolB protein